MPLPAPSENSTALVTGASSGIGAEIARALAERGHGVTLVARREDRLTALAEEIEAKLHVGTDAIGCDLSDASARDRLIAEIRARGLDVAILVNNAGFGSAGRFQELDLDGELRMVRTNVEAVVHLCGEYVPGMIDRGEGAVLNVASTAAFQPLARQSTYSASKAFVLGFTEALSSDLKDTGVTATALCPGPVLTEFPENAGIDAEDVPKFVLTSPEHNAAAAVSAMDKGKRVVVPGRLNLASAAAGHYTPRSVLLGLARRFYPVGK